MNNDVLAVSAFATYCCSDLYAIGCIIWKSPREIIKKIFTRSLLLSFFYAVYRMFDWYIVFLVTSYSPLTVTGVLYASLVPINLFGVYFYYFLKDDFLELEAVKAWILKDDGSRVFVRSFLRNNTLLSFYLLSVYPCPMAAVFYLEYVAGMKRRCANVVRYVMLGSIPCALIWGGGLSLVWQATVKLLDVYGIM